MKSVNAFVVTVSVAAALAACGGNDLSAGALLTDVKSSDEQAIHQVCPAGETTYGIDVSYYQGDIDWARAAGAGVKFAIVRVSDGTGFRDPKFQRNWDGAKANGIVRGAYQFFRSDDDPIEQAELLLSMMGPLEPGDLPPVADVESTDGVSNATRAERLQQWLDHVEAALGVTPIIYTGGYFWQDNVGADFSRYPLWHAGYTGGTCPSTVANQWPGWQFWQFGSTGRVAGISGNVDENHFNGSLAQLREFASSNRPPRGYLDAATCDGGISGWAQDEDTADTAIDVHVYIDSTNHIARAEIARDDLCGAIGSCAHGYVVDVPRSVRDGAAHTVVVWGIDDQGQHSILSGSGMTFQCDPPPAPAKGILRHIQSPDVMTAWGFSFDDVARYSDAAIAGLAIGRPFVAAPRLVRGDGDNAVYIVDGGSRRHVQDPASLAAWGFDLASLEVLALADVLAMPEGPALPADPVLLRGEGPAVYIVDVEAEVASEGEGEGNEGEGNEGEGEASEGEGEGAGDPRQQNVRVVTVGPPEGCAATPPAPLFVFAVLLLVRRRRNGRDVG